MHVSVFLDRTQRKGSSQEDILCAFWLHPRLFRLSLCPTMDKGDGWTVPGSGCTSLVVTTVFLPDNGKRRWEERSWFRVFRQHMTRAIRRRLEPCLYLTRCKVQNAPRERGVHAIDTVERTLYKSNLEATSRKTLALYCQNTTKRQASPKSLR